MSVIVFYEHHDIYVLEKPYIDLFCWKSHIEQYIYCSFLEKSYRHHDICYSVLEKPYRTSQHLLQFSRKVNAFFNNNKLFIYFCGIF